MYQDLDVVLKLCVDIFYFSVLMIGQNKKTLLEK